MQTTGKQTERRKMPRYNAKDGAFAVMTFSPYSIKLGRIVDISSSGLAFFYESWEEWPQDAHKLDILFGEKGFYIDKLAIETISDVSVPNESPFMATKIRRRGVKFAEMTPEQRAQLDYFLTNLTIESVPH